MRGGAGRGGDRSREVPRTGRGCGIEGAAALTCCAVGVAPPQPGARPWASGAVCGEPEAPKQLLGFSRTDTPYYTGYSHRLFPLDRAVN